MQTTFNFSRSVSKLWLQPAEYMFQSTDESMRLSTNLRTINGNQKDRSAQRGLGVPLLPCQIESVFFEGRSWIICFADSIGARNDLSK